MLSRPPHSTATWTSWTDKWFCEPGLRGSSVRVSVALDLSIQLSARGSFKGIQQRLRERLVLSPRIDNVYALLGPAVRKGTRACCAGQKVGSRQLSSHTAVEGFDLLSLLRLNHTSARIIEFTFRGLRFLSTRNSLRRSTNLTLADSCSCQTREPSLETCSPP